MSVRLIAEVWEIDGLTQAEQAVLLCLADSANDAGICWPGVPLIAWKVGIEERSARRIIKRLEEQGLVDISGGGGRWTSNLYRVTLYEAARKPPLERTDLAEKKAAESARLRSETLTAGSAETLTPRSETLTDQSETRTARSGRTVIEPSRTAVRGTPPERQHPIRDDERDKCPLHGYYVVPRMEFHGCPDCPDEHCALCRTRGELSA